MNLLKYIIALALLAGCSSAPKAVKFAVTVQAAPGDSLKNPSVIYTVKSSAVVPVAKLSAAQIIVPPASQPFGFSWESKLEATNEITGVESSTDNLNWHREAAWPLVAVSNYWFDPDAASPQKFYRALNDFAN